MQGSGSEPLLSARPEQGLQNLTPKIRKGTSTDAPVLYDFCVTSWLLALKPHHGRDDIHEPGNLEEKLALYKSM